MHWFIVCFEIIGTAAFALSSAMTGIKKNMDVFGVCVLGLTTAVGGGMVRYVLLGITPPSIFKDPLLLVVGLATSAGVFIATMLHRFTARKKLFETLLLISDSAGLGIFTVCGLRVAIYAGYGDNPLLLLLVAVMTGVGGGVLRDIFAGDRPYIFVKHIYACAALAGAVVCRLMWAAAGQNISMITGFLVVVILRLCSARFRWSLPKANYTE